MKQKLLISILVGLSIIPFSAQASIFDDLYGAVRGIQKQVVTLVSTKIDLPNPVTISTPVTENWNNFSSTTLGYEVEYPRDFSTTSIFTVVPGYKNVDAFVRTSREDFLKKILKPDTISVDLAVQDAAIFFRDAKIDDMYVNQNKYLGRISTSTKQIGSSTVEYILHSEKTDPSKFGGGTTEKVIFTNGSTTIEAEANYGADTAAGPTKAVFDKMLNTFKFLEATTSTAMIDTATSSLGTIATSSQIVTGTSTWANDQTAGAVLSQ